ncbi:uncharacterized protein K452DRAFT_75661 [Aplosporella prunicola CBS 121167]|uniref:Secreted protein n=1 Tax=Aplosporella prunicola CBS 121167 TaxID=1176127 RepID=A0A6A6B904_9PEZI|nr:uncharacterized protein K452DRAFT_75661 [Aplosporella prunicola CBS 121167]KAF2139347.1 hypothetical protein K452DRAFT_75661 [Aplosporella prunicola CBS 121167]
MGLSLFFFFSLTFFSSACSRATANNREVRFLSSWKASDGSSSLLQQKSLVFSHFQTLHASSSRLEGKRIQIATWAANNDVAFSRIPREEGIKHTRPLHRYITDSSPRLRMLVQNSVLLGCFPFSFVLLCFSSKKGLFVCLFCLSARS